jgi:hypothetical protein
MLSLTPAVRQMRGILDLDPMSTSAGAISAVEVLRDNFLKAHVAGDAK